MACRPQRIILANAFEANYTVGFCKGLASNSLPFRVLSCEDTESRLKASQIENTRLASLLPKGFMRFRPLALLSDYFALVQNLYQGQGAVLHFIGIFRNTKVVFEGLIYCLLCKAFGSRFILTVHNVLPHGKDHSRLFKAIYWLLYRCPDYFLIHTTRGRQQLIEDFSVPEGRVVATSIGVNEEIPVTSLSKTDALHRLSFDSEQKHLLCFGKMEPYKGVDRMIEAFGLLEDSSSQLVLAGSFNSRDYKDQVMALIAASQRRSDIIVHDHHIPNEDVEAYFKACDALVLPYRNIYQSGVLFLCLNFGMPIVATNVGSLEQYITENVGLITESNDPASISKALDSLLSRQPPLDRQTIRNYARQFTWENTCKPIMPLYEVPEPPIL